MQPRTQNIYYNEPEGSDRRSSFQTDLMRSAFYGTSPGVTSFNGSGSTKTGSIVTAPQRTNQTDTASRPTTQRPEDNIFSIKKPVTARVNGTTTNQHERFGLLFYKDLEGSPLQANFAEIAIEKSKTIGQHLAQLNPACHTGILLYLSRVKLPAVTTKMLFENEFISTNNYGGNIWIQDTMAVIAVRLVFDAPQRRDVFSSDFFENPVIYKGKTVLSHARLKPSGWGTLAEIVPFDLTGDVHYEKRYWMPLLAS